MQLTCLLLLALGATTLATPIDIPDPSFPDFNGTSAFTGHELEKRGTYGWLASYRTSDTSCNQGYAGDRPKISKSCINFVPVEGGNSIGINWGTWPYQFDSLNFYGTKDCLNKPEIVKAPDHHNRQGAQTCYLNAGWVRSVQTSDTAKDAPT